ncbi:MAG TPA: hypothetical protein VHC47_07680 [Mucilaginibacter sp.]|nr:hypothetical protein [Mucilaginibacter sp.]
MKKLILLFGILFSVNAVFGQQFKPVKVDSLVTVSMPANYAQKDTLGQHIFSANTDLGYIITIVEPNAKNTAPLKKAKDLNNVLTKYIDGIQKQSVDGSTQNIRDTTVGSLKAKVFTLRTDDANGNVQDRDFLLLYTQDATYTFEFGYDDARKEIAKDERKAYFGSIKLAPQLQLNDQYTDIHSSASSVNTFSIIEIGAGVLILFLIVWLVFLKGKPNELA